jgi:hypothetical protein
MSGPMDFPRTGPSRAALLEVDLKKVFWLDIGAGHSFYVLDIPMYACGHPPL